MKNLKALSFFTGAMGLDLGLKKAGIEIILACESEKFIRDTIKLNNPKLKDWEGPDAALSVVYSSDKNAEIPSNHHYSVRTKDWRYILYNTGEEELYNNANDPKEWNNLIFEKKHPKTKEMRKILKEITSPIIPQGFSNIK